MSIDRNTHSYPTVGQLERELAQKINGLYQEQFGHRASKVDCHLFDNKIIVISEDITTPVEKLLLTAPLDSLIDRVRNFLDSLIKEKLEKLTEEVVKVKVNSCVYNTNIDTDSAVAIIMLENSPQVRHKKPNRRRNNNKNLLHII